MRLSSVLLSPFHWWRGLWTTNDADAAARKNGILWQQQAVSISASKSKPKQLEKPYNQNNKLNKDNHFSAPLHSHIFWLWVVSQLPQPSPAIVVCCAYCVCYLNNMRLYRMCSATRACRRNRKSTINEVNCTGHSSVLRQWSAKFSISFDKSASPYIEPGLHLYWVCRRLTKGKLRRKRNCELVARRTNKGQRNPPFLSMAFHLCSKFPPVVCQWCRCRRRWHPCRRISHFLRVVKNI